MLQLPSRDTSAHVKSMGHLVDSFLRAARALSSKSGRRAHSGRHSVRGSGREREDSRGLAKEAAQHTRAPRVPALRLPRSHRVARLPTTDPRSMPLKDGTKSANAVSAALCSDSPRFSRCPEQSRRQRSRSCSRAHSSRRRTRRPRSRQWALWLRRPRPLDAPQRRHPRRAHLCSSRREHHRPAGLPRGAHLVLCFGRR
jgi:hypothetical protein